MCRLKLFIWSIHICYPDEYIALAHTVEDARVLIEKELGYHPSNLDQDPEVYETSVAFVSIGDP
jgi:hypothetical protein